jgi:transposase
MKEADRRNVIERLFCKLKNWRCVATRYDTTTPGRKATTQTARLFLEEALLAF